MARPAKPARQPRIVFLTREPVLHQRGGSTTYALGLLDLLRRHAKVTLVSTIAYSRSPRLFFRLQTAPPEGVRLRFPGYWRFGRLYMCPFRPKAWARALARWERKRGGPRLLQSALQTLLGDRLYTNAWDLTAPTRAERRVATREITAARASSVLANYCFWGPFLGEGRLGARRTAILMHDLLSARIQRFQEAGLPLDCPHLSPGREMRWLAGAHTVLAAQEREAETIRPHIKSRVLVAPVTLRPRALSPDHLVAGRCLFVGSNIPPNRTGLAFLLREVWPEVRAEVPHATLAIVGTVCQTLFEFGAEHELRAQGIHGLGTVDSLETEYARAAVCLVPLLVGSGIKIKLLEALGFGKAVVSTPVGIQGLESWAGETVLVADNAPHFAEAITCLLAHDDLRAMRESSALRLAEEHFGVNRALDPEFTAALL